MKVITRLNGDFESHEVIELYRANNWSAADKPEQLLAALRHSHSVVTARVTSRLVGLANAISDGHLVVYYPHMLVHPDYHGNGIGREMMAALQTIYSGFHMQMLTADAQAVEFYKAVGFEPAGQTQAMWMYGGDEH
jgi:GNAT superfamily N-acetyltransferase